MKKLITLIITLCICVLPVTAAQDGSWALTTGGDYSTPGNWVDGNIADDSTSIAYFTNGITAFSQINLQTNRTIGTLNLSGEGDQWWFAGEGNILTLDDGGTTPIIDVGGNLWGVSINANLSGSDGFNKTGAKILNLYDSPVSGTVTVVEGMLSLAWDSALQNADVIVSNGSILEIANTKTANCESITVDFGVIKPSFGGSIGINSPITMGANEFSSVIDSDNLTNTININGSVTMSADCQIGVGGNASVMNINQPITGPYKLHFLPHSDNATHINTININAVNTYGGETILDNWGCKPVFELNVNHGFPLTDLKMELHSALDSTSVTLDLNDSSQKVSSLIMTPGDGSFANQYLEITGNKSGILTVTNIFWSDTKPNGAHVKISGGTLVLENGCNIGVPVVIENATFINKGGWAAGPDGRLELKSGAKIGGSGLGWEGGAGSNLVIPASATISPGNSVGVAVCWNLEMQNGSLYDWEVENGTTSDLIDVRGTLNLPSIANSLTVNVSVIGGIDESNINMLFYTANSSEEISGSTNNIFLSYEIGVTGPEHPYFDANTNMVISGIVVPEPGIIGLLSLLALAILRRK